jgi:hypothetical protein
MFNYWKIEPQILQAQDSPSGPGRKEEEGKGERALRINHFNSVIINNSNQSSLQ